MKNINLLLIVASVLIGCSKDCTTCTGTISNGTVYTYSQEDDGACDIDAIVYESYADSSMISNTAQANLFTVSFGSDENGVAVPIYADSLTYELVCD